MKVLAIIAHPDDETMLAGGTLALLARAGAQVHYLCATRGEGGERGTPPLCSRQELGTVREQELRCAVQSLGGAGLEFLGYTDPPVGEANQLYPYADNFDELVARIQAHIRQQKPQAVITHGSGGEYGHPAHVITHQAVRAAVESLGENACLLYTFSPAFPEHPRPELANPDDPAHLVLDIAPVAPQKIAAALCHKTQNALFVRHASQRTGRQLTMPEIVMRVEGLHRALPPVHGALDDKLAALLRPWAKRFLRQDASEKRDYANAQKRADF